MDNNNKELSPKELLQKLKESLSEMKEEANADVAAPATQGESVGASPVASEELSDEEIMLSHESEDAISVPEDNAVPVMKYRFSVRRPEPEEPQDEEEPVHSADELLPVSDTEIDFSAGAAPDVNVLMGDMLTPEEIAELSKFGSMPDAADIAEQARAEAEAAFEAGEMPSFDEADEVPDMEMEISDISVADEVEAEDADFLSHDEPVDSEDQEEERAESVIHADGSITPDESSRLNAMNYITSLTKKAAAAAAADSAAEAVATAETVAEAVTEIADSIGEEKTEAPVEDEEPVIAEQESGEEVSETPTDFDEVDVNLMLAFGMEDELKDALGAEDAEKVTAQAEEDAKAITSTDLMRVVVAEEPAEFTDYTQTKEIFARLKKQYRKALFSLGGAIILTLLLFLFENIPAMGGSLPEAFDKGTYPLVNLMVGLQLSLFAYVLVFQQVKRGVLSLIDKKWIPECGTALVVILSFLYQIIMALFCRGSYTTYNFPIALCILLSLAHDFMNCKREIYSFNVVASKKLKCALCTLPDEEAQKEKDAFRPFFEAPVAQEENEFADVPDTDELPETEEDVFEGRPMYRLKQGSFVDGFFERLSAYPSYKAVLKLILPATAGISLLLFVIAALRAGSFSYGVSMAYFALAMCAPMSMFITYSYPLYKASRAAYRADSAIIGEKAIEEYLDAQAITFEDKDIFPTKGVKVKSIKVYGAHRIDRVVFNAANIFRKYGGPLSQVFNMATLELGVTDDVYFGVIEEDGIEAMVGGNHIYLGKTDYLRRKGYDPGFDDEDEVIEGNGGICVMFMAIDEEVAAKFYVEYTIEPEFESILRALYSAGVCIGVRTFDPNIDDRMLSLLLGYGDYPVRVIKCRTEQSSNLAREHLQSGIVSKRSVKDMLRAFMSCDRVLRSVKLGSIIKIVAMVVGAVLSIVVAAMAVSGVASVWAALYQLFWLIPLILYARLTV